jgi:replicative DNA helicase
MSNTFEVKSVKEFGEGMMIYNYEAETAVLGSILADGTLFGKVELVAEHFFFKQHKLIFQAMKKAHHEGVLIDIVMVTSMLGNKIENAGGPTYLLKLVQSVATTVNLKRYEKLILEAYQIRKCSEVMMKFLQNPKKEEIPIIIRKLQQYQEIGAESQDGNIFEYLIELSKDFTAKSSSANYLSCFEKLDLLTGGWQRGDLIIIAARPSVGKTAFALNLAANHCKNGHVSIVFSLEMGKKQLMQRLISREGRINSQKWRGMSLTPEDLPKVSSAISEIADWNLQIYDSKNTLHDIRYTICKLVHENPDANHLVVVDYLQLIVPPNKGERQDISIGEITRDLKLLAIELNIPIILLSQLSRGVESRTDKRPMLSDLRGSGHIEQDADVIMFLYRNDYYQSADERDEKIEVILAKHRNGPTGTVKLTFNKAYGLFE